MSARYGPRIDANQKEIVDALRAAGASVQSLARVKDGCPDLLVGYRGVNYLFEVKMPGAGFKPKQEPWYESWLGTVYVIESPEEAIAILHKRGKPAVVVRF